MHDVAGWAVFALAFAAFLLSHIYPVRPPIKSALVRRLGPAGFTLIYSGLSLAALAWLIRAANHAPVVILWGRAAWQDALAFAALAAALVLAALAIGRPNPLSFGGADNASFDPAHPGLIGWVRHPLLVALLLWSLGHIPANGTLAHVILFAAFAGFSALGMGVIDRRKQRELGRERWAACAAGRAEIRLTRAGILRVLLAAFVYAGLLAAHGPVIGVQPAL